MRNTQKGVGAGGKKLLITAGILMLVLVVVFALLVAIVGGNKGKFQSKSYINGIDVSGLTPTEASARYNEQIEDAEFTLTNGKRDIVVLGSSFGYKESIPKNIDYLLVEKSNISNLMDYFKVKEYSVPKDISFDKQKLEKVAQNIASDFNKDAIESINARVENQNGTFVIVDEVKGTVLDPKPIAAKLLQSVENHETKINLQDESFYIAPLITKADIEANGIVEKLNKAGDLNIGYTFGYTNEEIPKDVLKSWIGYDQETGEMVVDKEKTTEYVSGLAKKYDTLRANRQFKTTDGKEITVGGGIYGWQMNVLQSVESLDNHIKNLDEGLFEPNYTTYGLVRQEGNKDIDDTYIEIDLTKQHMWFYKNGELLVDTDIVSGLPTEERETPTGVYSVWSKETKRYLEGDDYKLWVEYWIPINWSGVGIHDATWQSSFGGNRYLTHGSHGCLNTPSDKVAEIYRNVDTNTPVIVYKS